MLCNTFREAPKKALFGRKKRRAYRNVLVFLPLLEPCERRRSERSSLRLSRLSLYDEEDLLLWRRIANGFYFRHTGGAEGVKTHAVLCVDEVFTQLGLQEDHLLSAHTDLHSNVEFCNGTEGHRSQCKIAY